MTDFITRMRGYFYALIKVQVAGTGMHVLKELSV